MLLKMLGLAALLAFPASGLAQAADIIPATSVAASSATPNSLEPKDPLYLDPEKAYADAMARERKEGISMVWDGMTMVPAPAGFTNPLTREGLAQGWRPVVVNNEVVGACNAIGCTSSTLQPQLFNPTPLGTAASSPKKAEVGAKRTRWWHFWRKSNNPGLTQIHK